MAQHFGVQRRQRFAVQQEVDQVVGGQVGHGQAGGHGGAGDVGRQHHVGAGQQLGDDLGFALEHVQPGGGDLPGLQCVAPAAKYWAGLASARLPRRKTNILPSWLRKQ